MAKLERVLMDAPEFKHPDDLLHRYLLLLERKAAHERGKRIASFALGDGDGTAFSELMDDYEGKTVARELNEKEEQAIAVEWTSILNEAISRLGIEGPSKTKGFTHQDLMRVLTFYEWKMISEKGWEEPVWSSPCPWRKDSGFDVTPDKG
jgi:hypothetical protein